MSTPRWTGLLLTAVALALIPWTLWLTFTLPAKHLSHDYDVAWVGFDVALAASFAATGIAVLKESKWLVAFAAVTGTMLVCDAWFDIVTANGTGERLEAILEAALAELPLAAVCAFLVYDAESVLGRIRGLRSR